MNKALISKYLSSKPLLACYALLGSYALFYVLGYHTPGSRTMVVPIVIEGTTDLQLQPAEASVHLTGPRSLLRIAEHYHPMIVIPEPKTSNAELAPYHFVGCDLLTCTSVWPTLVSVTKPSEQSL